jgi:hypothetical protein
VRRSTPQINRREQPVEERHLRRVQQEAGAVDRDELGLVDLLLVATGHGVLGCGAREAVDRLRLRARSTLPIECSGPALTPVSSTVSRRAAASRSSPGLVRPLGMLHGARRL